MSRKTILGLKLGSLGISSHDSDANHTTILGVRRVKPKDTAEHVQVDVVVLKRGEKRTTRADGYIQLTPAEAETLAHALLNAIPPYAGGVAENDAKLAEFFGVDGKVRIG